MSAAAPRSPRRVFAVTAFAFAAILPLFSSAGGSAMENMVLAAAYVIMALGLNIVVGFAGLLDLGYVAFFAIGAHVAAYFGSTFWANAAGGAGIALFVGEPAASTPGIHFNFLIVEETGSVRGCPFGNLVVELATRDEVVRSHAAEILSKLRRVFATAITAAMEAGELPADLDANDLAEAILAHLEGVFVIAKARNDPAVFERLPRDIGRLLASPA